MSLTPAQQTVFDSFCHFIGDQENHLACFSGFAGSGKSFTLTECIKSQPSLNVAMLAATNKAVNNIKAITDGLASQYGTVHSFLGLAPSTEDWTEDDELELTRLHALGGNITPVEQRKLIRLEKQKQKYLSGDLSFNQSDREQNRVGLVIIDEAFMLNKEVVELCENYSRQNDIKVLFVGDPFQLPPVNEKKSHIFNLPIKPQHRWQLTDVVRYSGSILTYATALRESVKLAPQIAYKMQSDYSPYIDDETVIAMSFGELKSQLPHIFAEPDKSAAFIAYTNQTVDNLNLAVRKILNKPLDSYIEGDVLVAHKKCGRTSESEINHYYGDSYIRTSQYMTVDSIISTVQKGKYKAQWLKVTDDVKCSKTVLVPVPSDVPVWKEDEKKASERIKVFNSSSRGARGQSGQAAKELWKELGLKNWDKYLDGSELTHPQYLNLIKDCKRKFATIANLFDPIQLAYCITCHKSQGSTIDYVFLTRELFESKTRAILGENYVNLLYTALTRTRDQLIILE